jgi:hypothetical protein
MGRYYPTVKCKKCWHFTKSCYGRYQCFFYKRVKIYNGVCDLYTQKPNYIQYLIWRIKVNLLKILTNIKINAIK